MLAQTKGLTSFELVQESREPEVEVGRTVWQREGSSAQLSMNEAVEEEGEYLPVFERILI